MTQPERPDRAAAEQLRHDRVAAQLRHAAHSYEPDSERIRRLIDARVAATGGTPIKARDARGLGGRTVMWPVVGSAAAAAVILAVAASGAPDTSGQTPAPGSVVVGGTPTGSSSTSGQIDAPTSTSVSGRPSASSPDAGRTTPGRGTVPGGAVPTGKGAASTTSGSVGGRVVTAVVRSVPGGQQVTLGASGETWALGRPASSPSVASAADPTGIAPIQGMTSSAVEEPGPFTIRWQNGTPVSSGTTSSWLVVPAVASSPERTLVHVPVRFKTDAFTVVLYVGTVGGSGRLEVGNAGTGPLRVDLPACGGVTCASVVTITSHGGRGVATTGDLPVEVFSDGATKVAIAAASLD